MKTKYRFLVMDCDGVLTDGAMVLHSDGSQSKRFNVKDGMGIKLCQEQGMLTGIISAGTSTGLVEARAEMLAIPLVYVGKEPKLKVLQTWLETHNLSLEEVVYIGDDVNDLPILEKCGAAFCPADAAEAVRNHPRVKTLTKAGGAGCVRELVDHHLL
jgi:YrbI family 3-deoxy-D-manno-octulosonate 8-phosphate phosphatase